MDHELDISRRKLLAGVGTAGIAAAGAGLGTTAYLSDTESFDDNMMTAGTLDLVVEYAIHEDQGSAGSYTINSFTDTIDGSDADVPSLNGDGTAMSTTLEDVKPGDSGYARFCFDVDDNPAYLWAFGDLTATAENGYTEPEPEDDNGEGELEEAIEVTVQYCDVNASGKLGGTSPMKGEITSGSLRAVLSDLQGGVPLDGKTNTSVDPANRAPFEASSPTASNPCVCLQWEVPVEVGNEIQGDSVTFDLGFYAEQARHNTPTDPFADVTLTEPDATPRGFAANTDHAHTGAGAWQAASDDKVTLYLGPDFAPFNDLSSFTVGDIEEISYNSWKATETSGSNPLNFYAEIYTEPQGGTVDSSPGTDDGSWYNKRINAEPYYADGLNAPGGQWNEWSTEADGTNELWFFDANRDNQGYGWYGAHPSFDDLTSGPVDWGNFDGGSNQTVDYASQTVKTIAIATASGWSDQFHGYLDDVTVTLTSGETLHLDLEQ